MHDAEEHRTLELGDLGRRIWNKQDKFITYKSLDYEVEHRFSYGYESEQVIGNEKNSFYVTSNLKIF